MLLTLEVEIKVPHKTLKHYEDLGYTIPKYKNENGKMVVKKGTKIIVKVNDLTYGSGVDVIVLCDQCKINIVTKIYKNYIIEHNKNGIDICNECRLENLHKNSTDIILKRYGVSNVFQLESVKKKSRETMLNKYGAEYSSQSATIREIIKLKNISKFGFEYANQSPEIKIKISKSNSYRWKGGITPENHRIRQSTEYKQWRLDVFTKDKFTCQCCGDNKGGNLHAHHKYNFSDYLELRFDVDNGITLCDKCHDFRNIGSFHHMYSTKNNTPEQLEQYINNYKELQRQLSLEVICNNAIIPRLY